MKINIYDCSCENKRLIELSQDLGHKPIIFIRFNPDSYKVNGKNIPSSWRYTKTGLCHIKDEKNWNNRLHNLKEQIHYWLENITDKLIEVIQLYYYQ